MAVRRVQDLHQQTGVTDHGLTRQTLDKLGIPRRTFARWYAGYFYGGPEALGDKASAPSRVWNRLPDDIAEQIIDMALDTTDCECWS
jgi:putative transposase